MPVISEKDAERLAARLAGGSRRPSPGPAPAGKANKFNATRCVVDGEVFDSKGEAEHYKTLLFLRRTGEISDLRRQVTYPIVINGEPVRIRSKGYPNGRAVNYIADFVYKDRSGATIIEDFKGFDTPNSRLKRALVEAIYGVEVILVKK